MLGFGKSWAVRTGHFSVAAGFGGYWAAGCGPFWSIFNASDISQFLGGGVCFRTSEYSVTHKLRGKYYVRLKAMVSGAG